MKDTTPGYSEVFIPRNQKWLETEMEICRDSRYGEKGTLKKKEAISPTCRKAVQSIEKQHAVVNFFKISALSENIRQISSVEGRCQFESDVVFCKLESTG